MDPESATGTSGSEALTALEHSLHGADPLPKLSDLPLGEAFTARYQVEGCLGSGASGLVVLAVDRSSGQRVAIKFLMRLSEEDRSRFLAEAHFLATVRDPGIVALVDSGHVDDHPYLVTEHLAGGTLRERLEREGRLTARAAVGIAQDVLSGLAACHAAGVVHRDVKPENILFDVEGRARLADLGIARLHEGEHRLTRTGALVGTPRYMAPEQLEGQDATPAADLHALGLVLFEMLAGRTAFSQDNLAVLLQAKTHPPPKLADVAPEVPAPLATVVDRACSHKIDDRPRSAADLSAQLEVAARDPWIEPWSEARPGKPLPPRSSAPYWLAFVGVALAMLLVGSPWMGGGERRPAAVWPAVVSGTPAGRASPATPVAAAGRTPPRPPVLTSTPRSRPTAPPSPRSASAPLTITSTAALLFPPPLVDRMLTELAASRSAATTRVTAFIWTPTPATGRALSELLLQPTPARDDGAFYDRLVYLRAWWGRTTAGQRVLAHVQRERYVNPMQAARRLDRCLLAAAAGQPPDILSAVAPLDAAGPPELPSSLDPGSAPPEAAFDTGATLVAEARALLGRRDGTHGRWFSDALAPLARAARANHRRAEALSLIGTALLLRDASPVDLDRARELLARSAALAPDRWTWLRLAQAEALSGQIAAARRALDLALALEPGWPEAHFLAAVLADASDSAGAAAAGVLHARAAAAAHARYETKLAAALRHSELADRGARFATVVLADLVRGPLTPLQRALVQRQVALDPACGLGLALAWRPLTPDPPQDPPASAGEAVEGISVR